MLLENLGRGAIGMFFLLFVCYLLSTNRKAINWKLIVIGVLAQIMFAMGVLHTTFFGQPVFWMLFGILLIYTIGRKFLEVRSKQSPVTFDGINLGLSALWQVLFIFGRRSAQPAGKYHGMCWVLRPPGWYFFGG